jgi:CDP-diacylglycerol--inositol 3-phosphatidyltransferase
MFNQTSTLGAVLDMVTDRVATSCLLAVLCTIYPSLQPIFLSLLMLDIFSHWFQMYATLAMGSATHKDVHSRSFIVRFYYKHRIFMGFCCVCVEALYLYAYLLGHEEYQKWVPVRMPKAVQSLAAAGGVTLLPGGKVPVLCLLCALVIPGFVIKQAINVVQLRTAAAQLVAYDQKRSTKRKS